MLSGLERKLCVPPSIDFTQQKNSNIVDMGFWCGKEWRWDLLWRRPWFTWEQSLVQKLMGVIGEFGPYKNGRDGWMSSNNAEKKCGQTCLWRVD